MSLTTDEMYIMAAGGGSWINLLQEMENQTIDLMLSEYHAGQHNYLTHVTKLACIREQIHKIKTAIKQVESLKESK